MADKEVKIDFVTKSKGEGAQKTKREIDKLESSVKKSTRTTDKKSAADKKARKLLDHVTNSAANLRKELAKSTGIDPRTGKSLENLTMDMDRASKSGKKLVTSQKGVKKSSRDNGQALLALSQGYEDLQYGIGGVLNNIPQLIQKLGGGAGLAGAISVAAVAGYQLVKSLGDVEEETEEVNEIVEELKGNLDRLHKEIASADFRTYLQRFDAVNDAYQRENQSISNNINLIELKRKSEIKLAQAQDNLELAAIAAREDSDESFTAEDAARARGEITRRQIQRGTKNTESEAQEKIDELTQKRLLKIRELAANEENLARLAADREEAERELDRLFSLRAQAEGFLKKAEKSDKDGNSKKAQIQRETAQQTFGSEKGKRFDELSKTVIPGLKGTENSILDQMIELRSAIADIGLDLDTAKKAGEISVETAKKLEKTQLATIDLKEGAEKSSELAKQVDEQVSTLLKTVDRNKISESAKVNFDRLVQITSDNIDDQKQMGEIINQLKELQFRGVIPVQELQVGVNTLSRKYDEIASSQSKIMENLRRIESRR